MMLTTVLAFLLTIAVLVVIHEYGHYRAAVACGVKVLRFSVGFGRVLWSRKRGETEFVVSALPLGGYVKMLDEREGPVAQSELHRAFSRKPLWQRAIIVSAGPLANLVLAVLLYACVNWIGVEELRPWFGEPKAGSPVAQQGFRARDEVVALRAVPAGRDDAAADARGGDWHEIRSMTDLQWRLTQAALKGQDASLKVHMRAGIDGPVGEEREIRVPVANVPPDEIDADLMDRIGLTGPFADPVIDHVMDGGPAQKAGLQHGDRVLQINGLKPQDVGQLLQAIRESHTGDQPQPLHMTVLRAGRALELTVLPVMKDVKGQHVPRIDAALGSQAAVVTVRYGLVEGFTMAVGKTWDMSRLSVEMLGKMVIGQASLKTLSGPLTIADYAGRSAKLGWVYYIGFLALVSVSLGVLNLLPLPVLDGGHLMYYLFEGLTGRPISDQWLERLQRGGVALMLVMMSLALYNDLARLMGAN